MSEALFTPNSSILDSELNGRSGGYRSYAFAARFEPTRMPDDWRAYIGYDTCILTDDDWRDLSPGARSALLQWNRMGGTLHVYSTSPTTDTNSLGIAGHPAGTRGATRSWGELKIKPIPTSKHTHAIPLR